MDGYPRTAAVSGEMPMKKKITICLAFLAAVAIFCAVVVAPQLLFLSTENLSVRMAVGIIDGDLSAQHPIISETNADGYTDSATHGDALLDFLAHFDVAEVYYYDASTDGIVSSANIMAGLEWMKAKGVRYVNISLSSKQYSRELASWIAENQNDITVYASFNNVPQSADYPAMYDGVIASGIETDFADNTDDCVYSSSKIVVDWNISTIYSGNSYLSLWTMISKINDATP